MNFKLRELIGFGVTVASVTIAVVLWVFSTFQSKAEAREVKVQFDMRLSKVEAELSGMRAEIQDVARDTSYIRGRLEPNIK